MALADRKPELGISEELAERLKDKNLLKTQGLIGGDWKAASDGATYQAREIGGLREQRRVCLC
jgi:hypothetical protein